MGFFVKIQFQLMYICKCNSW